MSGAGAGADSSVCYRHPDRTSWTLCERCGRTICPECQIATPQGVRCPTCIEELGGSVRWAPAAGIRPKPVKAKRVRVRATSDSPGWRGALARTLRPGDTTPVLSWGASASSVLLWIVSFFTTLPAQSLIMSPSIAPLWQLWRFVTTSFVYVGLPSILSLIFGIVFLLLNGPMIEREIGRRRFAALFLASGAMGAAWMAIAGLSESGLFTPIFGLLGCYLVLAWPSPRARTQMFVTLGILLGLNLLLSPFEILAIIGNFGAGAGAMQLVRVFDERPRSRPSTPYLILTAGVLVFVLIAIVRQLISAA
jgi:membrane associated rhomboid family serine protease